MLINITTNNNLTHQGEGDTDGWDAILGGVDRRVPSEGETFKQSPA